MPGYKLGTCINNGDCTGKQWAVATGAVVLDVAAGAEVKSGEVVAALSKYTANDVFHLLGRGSYTFSLTAISICRAAVIKFRSEL